MGEIWSRVLGVLAKREFCYSGEKGKRECVLGRVGW